MLQHPWLAQRVNLTAGLLGTVRTYSSFSDRPRGCIEATSQKCIQSACSCRDVVGTVVLLVDRDAR